MTVVDGLTDDLMALTTEASPTDDSEDDDGLSGGIIALIVILITLFILALVTAIAAYLLYRQKHKKKYDIQQLSFRAIDSMATANPYVTVKEMQSSQVQEIVSTEPEIVKENSPKEESTDHKDDKDDEKESTDYKDDNDDDDDDDDVKANTSAAVADGDDKDTSL